MSVMKLRRRHPRAELACPPLRWRAVGQKALRVSIVGGVCATAGGLALWRWQTSPEGWLLWAWIGCFGVSAVCVLWLTHLVNVARTPVTFAISNGEMIVTRPFLFWRRRRRLATSSVRGVRVSATRPTEVITTHPPTGRLSIRRRNRLPLRVPGRRPLAEINRVAEELRTVLGV